MGYTPYKEEDLQNRLSEAFVQTHLQSVLNIIQEHQYPVHEIIDQTFLILDSQELDRKFIEFSILMLDQLTKIYGISIILILNTLKASSILLKIANSGFQNDVKNLISVGMAYFSDDEGKKTVPHVACLLQKLNSLEKPKTKRFIEIFKIIQDLLTGYKDLSIASEKQRIILYKKIKDLVESGDLVNEEFNPAEKELMSLYFAEMTQILSSLEREIHETSKQDSAIQEEQKEISISQADNLLFAANNERKKEFRFRTYFELNEALKTDESVSIEYKDYSHLFTEDCYKALKKTICSFLNRRGGRIYIGVQDNYHVKGITLTIEQRDDFRLEIQKMLRSFEPGIISANLVKVRFLPIVHPENNMPIPDLFVAKIIVKQGDPSQLYSTSKEQMQCFIRNDGHTTQLNSREIIDLILARNKSPGKRVSAEEFDDPESDEFLNSHNQG